MSNHEFHHGQTLSQSALSVNQAMLMPGATATSFRPDHLSADQSMLRRWYDDGMPPVYGSQRDWALLKAKAEVLFEDKDEVEGDSSV